MKFRLCFFLGSLFAFSGFASPIYEPFNYTSGANLIGQVNSFDGNISWLQAGPTTAVQPTILSGNLDYPGRPPSKGNSVVFGGLGTSARFSFPDLNAVRKSLFYSFVMKIEDLTGISTSGIFWASFNDTQGTQTTTPSSVCARLQTRGVTNSVGEVIGYQLGIVKNSGTLADFVFSTNVFTTDDIVFVVVGYVYTDDASTDTAKLWINPDPSTFGTASLPPTDWSSSAGGNFRNIRSFVLFNRNAAEPKRVIVDDLLIGPTWADVTPSANDMQPSLTPVSQRVVPGMDALFEIKSARADSFRWQFNGTDIPGGTGTRVVVTNAQLSNAGPYSVIMSNAAALVTNTVTLSVVSTSSPVLSPLWSLAPGSRTYITGGDGQRTMAYYAPSNHLYVLSRTNNSPNLGVAASGLTINVLNSITGDFLYTLNTETITNDPNGIILGGIAVADDGAIYACNIATTSGSGSAAWRLYRWASGASSTVPSVVFGPANLALQTTALRWGDVLTVRGSGVNTQILVDDHEGLFATMLTPTDATMNTFEYLYSGVVFQYFSQSYGRGSLGRSLQFGSEAIDPRKGTIWQIRRGRPYGRPTALVQTAFDLDTRTSSTVSNLNVFSSLTGPLAMDFNSNYLAAISFAPDSSTPDSLALYDISDFSQPLLLSRRNFPVNRQSNANSFGQTIVSSNKVFALDANNGLMAFEIALAPPSLTITRSGNDVILSWASSATGFMLQKTLSLTAPDWVFVTEPIQEQNGQNIVTNQITGNASFYRLSKSLNNF